MTHADPRIGTTLKAKWRVDALLGAGGMATVYAATHRNGKRVAIKMLRPELCWGDNYLGSLGNNSTANSLVPVPVSGLTSGIVAIAAGQSHACAVDAQGGVQCSGDNYLGDLGNNGTTNSLVPIPVMGLSSGVAAVAAGNEYSCALTTAGGVQCWGGNPDGELGNGSFANSFSPVAVSGLSSGVTSIASCNAHACARTTAGVQFWGYNMYGQLGNNSTSDSNVPVSVAEPCGRCIPPVGAPCEVHREHGSNAAATLG